MIGLRKFAIFTIILTILMFASVSLAQNEGEHPDFEIPILQDGEEFESEIRRISSGCGELPGL